jgi:hypothetical protein
MIEIRFREGERLTDVACVRLAQRIVPALHVTSFPAGLGRTAMPRTGEHVAISFPEITHTPTAFIRRRNASPQLATGLFTALPQGKRDNLSRPATQRRPQPALLFPCPDKAPHFIQLQLIARSRGQQGGLEGSSLRCFFLTTLLAFAAPLQSSAQSHAYWAAHNRRPESGSSRLRCRAR